MVTHTADPECIGLQYATPFRADPLPFPIAAARRSTASRSFSIDATILSCSRSAGPLAPPQPFPLQPCLALSLSPRLLLPSAAAIHGAFALSRRLQCAASAFSSISRAFVGLPCLRGDLLSRAGTSSDAAVGRSACSRNGASGHPAKLVSQFCRSSSKRAFVTGWPLPVLVAKRICTRYDAGS
jgi:hypothetical protein